MWPLFVLFLCVSWTPLLLLYLSILAIIRYSSRAAVSTFLQCYIYNPEEVQAHVDATNATCYDDWQSACHILDTCWDADKEWKADPADSVYRWQGIERRVEDLTAMIKESEVENLSWRLGQFPVRHYCNITDPRLYRRLRTGTKALIERYVDVNVEALSLIANWPRDEGSYLTDEIRLDSFRAPRTAFGRTALVLQGDGIFGLFHLGVVKELLLRGLLPRVIVGNKTGALVAALVGVFSDEELIELLSEDGLHKSINVRPSKSTPTWHAWERTLRLLLTGNTPHQTSLADYVYSKIGDTTFIEAYEMTQKPLSITVQFGNKKGMPVLMNHISAPKATIYSAALVYAHLPHLNVVCEVLTYVKASSEPDPVKAFSMIFVQASEHECESFKVEDGPFDPSDPWPYADHRDIKDISPLTDVRQYFNVNHFVVSQTRPLMSSFLTPSSNRQHYPLRSSQSWAENALWLLSKELRHRIRQAQRIGIAPNWTVEYLHDEIFEESIVIQERADANPDNNDVISIVPEFQTSDIDRLLHGPRPSHVKDWILRGQRAVWPAVSALDVRCGLEVAYEYYYQLLKHGGLDGVENTPIVSPKTTAEINPYNELKGFAWPKDGQSGRRPSWPRFNPRRDSIDSM